MTTSTINTTVPATGSTLASAPLRANFAAAASDINALFGLVGTGSSSSTSTYAIVAAAGTTQSAATLISASTSVVSSGPANAGVRLPASSTDTKYVILNRSANNAPLNVYPPTSGTIEGQAANLPGTITLNGDAVFFTIDGTNWFAY